MFKLPRHWRPLSVITVGVFALATSPSTAFARDQSGGSGYDDTANPCIKCGTNCPADLVGQCQTWHCGSGAGTTCALQDCNGVSGRRYPYTITCMAS